MTRITGGLIRRNSRGNQDLVEGARSSKPRGVVFFLFLHVSDVQGWLRVKYFVIFVLLFFMFFIFRLCIPMLNRPLGGNVFIVRHSGESVNNAEDIRDPIPPKYYKRFATCICTLVREHASTLCYFWEPLEVSCI